MLTVIVASCDNYSDLWRPFSVLFRKYWKDCPYDSVLVTETAVTDKEPYIFDKIIACGKGVGWADRLAIGLHEVKTPYVILLCDDYFLCDHVDTNKIRGLLGLAQKYHVGYFPMIKSPETCAVFSETEGLVEFKKGTAYCIATQAGIWDVDFLKQLAKGYNSIWEFERLGSFQCAGLEQPILGTRQMVFPFEDVVHKGKWEEFGVRLCDRNGIEIDFSRRGKMSHLMAAKEHLKGAILDVNPTLVVKFQNLFGLGKK